MCKIAIITDQLIERDNLTSIVDLLAEKYEAAEIFTLAFRPKTVLGTIEHRKIHSTFLSHTVQDYKSLLKRMFLIPGAIKSISVPEEFDVAIMITKGLIEPIKLSPKTKLIRYVYSNDQKARLGGLLSFFFRPYLNKFFKTHHQTAAKNIVAHLDLAQELQIKDEELIVQRPFFNVHEFRFDLNLKKPEYFLINAETIDFKTGRNIIKSMRESGMIFKFIGKDDHLQCFNCGDSTEYFIGKRCEGELDAFLQNAYLFIDLNPSGFPVLALSAMATGTPVLALNNAVYKRYLDIPENIGVDFTHWKLFINMAEEKVDQFRQVNAQKLRDEAMKYNSLKFKSILFSEVEKFL